MKTLRRKLVGYTITVTALLLITITTSLYLNQRAENEASAFCDRAPVGSSITSIMSLARLSNIRSVKDAENQYRFQFSGWLGNSAQCVVAINGGLVIAKIVVEAMPQ